MKPGFIPKTSKIYPLSEKERSAVKAFIDENKKVLSPSRSPLKRVGSFLLERRAENSVPVKITGISTIGQ